MTHLSAYFDTHVGHKQEQQSYENIAKSLEVDPQQILFLTDIPGGEEYLAAESTIVSILIYTILEAAAARSAGLQAILLQRPGNAALTDAQKSAFEVIPDFKPLHSLKLPSN